MRDTVGTQMNHKTGLGLLGLGKFSPTFLINAITVQKFLFIIHTPADLTSAKNYYYIENSSVEKNEQTL